MTPKEIIKAHEALAKVAVRVARVYPDHDDALALTIGEDGDVVLHHYQRGYYDSGDYIESDRVPLEVFSLSEAELLAWEQAREAREAAESAAISAKYAAEMAARERATYEALRAKFEGASA